MLVGCKDYGKLHTGDFVGVKELSHELFIREPELLQVEFLAQRATASFGLLPRDCDDGNGSSRLGGLGFVYKRFGELILGWNVRRARECLLPCCRRRRRSVLDNFRAKRERLETRYGFIYGRHGVVVAPRR